MIGGPIIAAKSEENVSKPKHSVMFFLPTSSTATLSSQFAQWATTINRELGDNLSDLLKKNKLITFV